MSWNIHPGEILLEEFMKPFGMNANQLARILEVPSPRINDIILQKRGISADTALRLAHYFGTSVKFWMNLQASYELRKVSEETKQHINTIIARSSSSIDDIPNTHR